MGSGHSLAVLVLLGVPVGTDRAGCVCRAVPFGTPCSVSPGGLWGGAVGCLGHPPLRGSPGASLSLLSQTRSLNRLLSLSVDCLFSADEPLSVLLFKILIALISSPLATAASERVQGLRALPPAPSSTAGAPCGHRQVQVCRSCRSLWAPGVPVLCPGTAGGTAVTLLGRLQS